MQPALRSLWLEIDRAESAHHRAQSVQVLADYYEESGENDAAELLRDRIEQKTAQQQSSQDLRRILKQMNRRSIRLFACACVDVVLPNSWTEARAALRVSRRFEFGLETKKSLVDAQYVAYELWSEFNVSSSTARLERDVLWALVRASGMVSRMRHADNVYPDALYAAKQTQRRSGFFEKAWSPAVQAQAAKEYLILGRMIEESNDVKAIWAEAEALGNSNQSSP